MTNQAGGGWIDLADDAVQIDAPDSVRAYAFAASWVTEHEAASLDGALDEDVAAQSFVSGRTAIEMNSTGGLTEKLEEVDFELGVPMAAERIAEHPEYLVANRQLDVAFARARPPAMPAIREAEPAVWQSIALGEQTAEEALGDFADRMRAMLARD